MSRSLALETPDMSTVKKRPTVANHVSRSVFDGQRILSKEQNEKLVKASAAALTRARAAGTDAYKRAQTVKKILERA